MITVYTLNDCNYCSWAIGLLERLKLEYKSINVSNDAQARQHLIDQGFTKVPQIYVNDEHIGGYTDLVNWVNDKGYTQDELHNQD